jgi:molybdenum cofactor cytidylyltransferase
VDRVVVVVGHRAEELIPLVESRKGAAWVLNPDYMQGKTTSIRTGLSALDPDVVSEILLLNVDQPRSSQDIAHILNTHRSLGYAVTVPSYEGKGGHPIVLSAELLDELLSIDEESQGIKAVVRRRPESVNRVPLDNPQILLDLNTPEQYRRAVETFAP